MLNLGHLYLLLAIVLETAGTTCMKLSAGFTRPWPSVLLFVFYGACFGMLTLALKYIEVSVCYALWSGLGTLIIALLGMTVFGEPVTTVRVVSLAMIIAGVVGLQWSSGGGH